MESMGIHLNWFDCKINSTSKSWCQESKKSCTSEILLFICSCFIVLYLLYFFFVVDKLLIVVIVISITTSAGVLRAVNIPGLICKKKINSKDLLVKNDVFFSISDTVSNMDIHPIGWHTPPV